MGEKSKGVSEKEEGANAEVKEKYNGHQIEQYLEFLLVLDCLHSVSTGYS